MRQITLNIPENKYSFFLELIKKFSFIKIKSQDDLKIPDFHKQIIDSRLKNSEKDNYIDWENTSFDLEQ